MSTYRRLSKLLVVAPLATLAFALSACGASATDGSSSAQGVSTSAVVSLAQPNVEPSRFHHGPHLPLLREAEHLSDLTADQSTALQAIRDSLQANEAPRHAARKELDLLLAKSLDDGKVDQVAIDAQLAKLQGLGTAEHLAFNSALTQLHATLTPTQRAKVVDDMKAHLAAHADKFAGKPGAAEGAPPEGAPPPPDFDKGSNGNKWDAKGHGPRHMFDDLDLTADQTAKLASVMNDGPKPEMPDHAAMAANMTAMHDAFAAEKFDPTSLELAGPGPAMGMGPGMGKGFGEHMVKLVTSAVDILDAGQRGKLATRIREHANKG